MSRAARFAPGFRVTLCSGAAISADGTVILGGRPTRLVRVPARDAPTLRALWAGEAVVVGPENSALIEALLDRDLVQPLPVGGRLQLDEVTVVIPVRDHLEHVIALMGAPGALAGVAEVVVVDDASSDPEALRSAVRRGRFPKGRVVRFEEGRGPAAARNLGAALAQTEIVAFVDADCLPEPGWMEPLLNHFDDAKLGAAAPRVRAERHGRARPSRLTEAIVQFELARGPLESGAAPQSVGPGHRLPLVPSTALVMRKEAFLEVGGFDERFTTGEDTDLEWRLVKAGWAIRYEPAAVVRHPARPNLREILRQRYVYGLPMASLADRHPEFRALTVERGNLVASALTAAAHPVAAAAVGVAGLSVPARSWQRTGVPAKAAFRHRLADQVADAHGLALNLWTSYWPLSLGLCFLSRRMRKALLVALVGPALVDWVRRRPAVPLWRWCGLHVLEQLAAGAGTWVGCLRARRFEALLPRWTSVPRHEQLLGHRP
jgi:mycofactocin system glycosyltransferase